MKGKRMKSIVKVLMLVSLIATLGGCATKVEPGWVGLKVNNIGTKRGVEDYPAQIGLVWYNPLTTDVHKYPVFTQQIVWTKDSQEGSKSDESITFNSKEGAVVNADIALAYSLDAAKVPHIFVEFRQDISVLTNGYMRSQVRDAFNRYACSMPVVDIYGPGKQQLLTNVKNDLNNNLGPRGFKFDMISFTGGLRVDPKVEAAINATIEATQKAIEAENKVREAKARAQQREAEATGEANALLQRSEAEAKSNVAIAQSLQTNPNLIEWRRLQNQADAIKQWDGKMPQVSGGAMPMIQLNPSAGEAPAK